MSQLQQCGHCHKPTTTRCSRCRLLLICSRECMYAIWPTHRPDCKAIQRGRTASANNGENPETVASIPLLLPKAEYMALFASYETVRVRYDETEHRLCCGDKTLAPRDKVRFYSDLLQVVDASDNEHEDCSLVHKMALNRRYNDVYRDAMARLAPAELLALDEELKRRRIGAWFKQQP